jgi:phage-related tail protein
MSAVIHARKLDEVQRGVETALHNFAGNGTKGNEPSDLTAMERIHKIGDMSALAIVEASETTAKDIKAAAQAAVEVAAEVMKEAEQLATELRGNGQKISEHLREFATLATKVSTAMRNTRAEVLNSAEDETPRK